jgi:hypothetical protein
MKSRVLIDFLLIVFLYLICAGLVYGAVTLDWPGALGVQVGNAQEFSDRFLTWSEVAGGISVFCAFAWYILGEWGPRANKLSAGTWLAIWFAIFLAVILGSMAAIFLGPDATENGWILAVFYIIWGPAFYYLTTVLFSPVNTKYIVPGSDVIRRGW